MSREQVTLSKQTIHNPEEARHYMRIKPVKGRVRVQRDDTLLAESDQAVWVLEAGRDIYDPVIYLPPAAVSASLRPAAKQTYCPLKGKACYFDLVSSQGQVEVKEIAWSYRETLDFAREIQDFVAFDSSRIGSILITGN